MKFPLRLGALLALASGAAAHGGLIIPPCRNNRGNVNIFNFTKAAGEQWMSGGSCAGDMCLWFNDGCFIGCPNCSSTVPNSTACPGGASICDRVVKPNCDKPTLMEPTLPEE